MNKRHNDEDSLGSKIYAVSLYSCLAVYTIVFLFGRRFLPPQDQWCPYPNTQRHRFSNPDYDDHPCHHYRTPYLLYLNLQEVEFAQRMIFAVILGGIIGFERRASERPAGIRTMSLVCLGSAFFCMCGQLAFKSSTMGWDAARVAAAVPSGVGFLGAGLIWKGSNTNTVTTVDGQVVKTSSQEVHGLTTAASVWLSAAVGVAVGGGRRLYIVSIYGVALVILVLRFGPQIYFAEDSESMLDFDDEVGSDLDWESISSDYTHLDNDNEEDNEEYPKGLEQHHEWGSGDNMNDLGKTRGSAYDRSGKKLEEYSNQAELPATPRRQSSSISRQHSSAPNIMALTYEIPIVDHGREKSKDPKPIKSPTRKKRGSSKNMSRCSFHG